MSKWKLVPVTYAALVVRKPNFLQTYRRLRAMRKRNVKITDFAYRVIVSFVVMAAKNTPATETGKEAVNYSKLSVQKRLLYTVQCALLWHNQTTGHNNKRNSLSGNSMVEWRSTFRERLPKSWSVYDFNELPLLDHFSFSERRRKRRGKMMNYVLLYIGLYYVALIAFISLQGLSIFHCNWPLLHLARSPWSPPSRLPLAQCSSFFHCVHYSLYTISDMQYRLNDIIRLTHSSIRIQSVRYSVYRLVCNHCGNKPRTNMAIHRNRKHGNS